MKQILSGMLALAALFGSLQATSAVTVTNEDAEEQFVIVTINGKRTEIALPPKGIVTTCEAGCFMAFPSGDILPLTGPEKIVVQGGKGQVQLR